MIFLTLLLAQVPVNMNELPIIVKDEGVKLGASATTINCVGNGVACTKSGKTMTLSVNGTVLQTTAAATYYVDPTGNNANACTASGTAACATLSGVFAKLPPRILHAITINVAAGAYTDIPSLVGNEVLANITINGPALTNVTPTTGSATGTITAVTNVAPATLTDSAATWTVNDFIGRLVTIGGESKIIASNTATVLTLASPLVSTPSGGAAYAIQKQAATWTTNTTGGALNFQLAGASFAGSTTVTVTALEFINNNAAGYGCQITMSSQGVTFATSRCYGANGGLLYQGGGAGVGGISAFHGVNSGMRYNTTASSSAPSGIFSFSNGLYYASTGYGINASFGGMLTFNGGTFTAQTNSASTVGGALNTGVVFNRGSTQATSVMVFKCLQAGPAGIVHGSNGLPASPPTFFVLDNLFIDGCSKGIDFSQGYGNALGAVLTALTCNNVTTCISVANGSRFRVPATWTLTGVTNDIQIDGVNYTKANLTGASPTRLPTTPNITGSSVWQ